MRHLLGTRSLHRDEAVTILDTARQMALTQERRMKKLPTLRGRTVVNLFYEDSTRTRISFETAAKRLGADVINFSRQGSSVSKGESLKDTIQTLTAMGADGIVIRHPASGAAQLLADADWVDISIVNAGDGMHEHPTQALLDAYTIRDRLHGAAATGRALEGVRVCIVGDVRHSRVARSNIWLLTTLGAEVTVVGPPTLLPTFVGGWPVAVFYDLDEAIARSRPQVVMMLRIQRERMRDAFFPNEREYARAWGLTEARRRRLEPGCLIMHPGPMNRGLEISSEAADAPESTVLEQVANGISVRMAVLFLTITGEAAPADENETRNP